MNKPTTPLQSLIDESNWNERREKYLSRCAVMGCESDGDKQRCPADGELHSHGRIHYDYCHSDLKFHATGWFYVCGYHYVLLCEARQAWEKGLVSK